MEVEDLQHQVEEGGRRAVARSRLRPLEEAGHLHTLLTMECHCQEGAEHPSP